MRIHRYHPLMISFHWLMLVLFVVALAAIEYRGTLPKGDPTIGQIMAIHKQAGVLVLLLAVLRLATRVSTNAPSVIGAWAIQRFAAHVVHILLYVVMFALPVSGILLSQSADRAVELFGWVVPTLVAPDQALRDMIKPIHEFVGNAVYFLVGLHLVAVLWHHFIARDETLYHMALRKNR